RLFANRTPHQHYYFGRRQVLDPGTGFTIRPLPSGNPRQRQLARRETVVTIAANTIDTRSRVRVIFKSYLVSGFARVSGLLVTLLTTPWLLAYLGKDQFGLWVILV